jgi:hypothetical protein
MRLRRIGELFVRNMSINRGKVAVLILVVAILGLALVMQHLSVRQLSTENEALRAELEQIRQEEDGASPAAASLAEPPHPAGAEVNELLRLRGEVGLLRRETNRLTRLLASTQYARGPEPDGAAEDSPAKLPADYPKTAEGAVKGIFDAWALGDWDTFFQNFGEPGVPRDVYDRAFREPNKSNYLYGMEIVSLGQPTNGPGQNSWWVPYKLRFRDGSEKEFQLHVAQDPRTQRWFFKGGF